MESVYDQTYRPVEVLVVDGGSTDETVARVAEFSGRRKVEDFRITVLKDSGTVSSARNLGIRASHGDNVLLLDADVLLSDSQILHQLYDALGNNDTAYFLTRTLVDSWLEYQLNLDSEAALFGFVTVAGWAFKRIVLDRIQFDESLAFGEDRDFLNRLSRFAALPARPIEGVGLRHFPHDLRELKLQKLWYGRTVLAWVGKHHSLRELGVLSPLVVFGMLVLLLPAFFLSLLLGVGLGLMFMTIPIYLLLRSRDKNAKRMAYLIFVRIIYGSVFFTLGFLQGLAQPSLRGSANTQKH